MKAVEEINEQQIFQQTLEGVNLDDIFEQSKHLNFGTCTCVGFCNCTILGFNLCCVFKRKFKGLGLNSSLKNTTIECVGGDYLEYNGFKDGDFSQ